MVDRQDHFIGFSKDLFGFRVSEAHTKYDMLATVLTTCNRTLLAPLLVECLTLLNLFTAEHTESIDNQVIQLFSLSLVITTFNASQGSDMGGFLILHVSVA